jgi:hypothetical protein
VRCGADYLRILKSNGLLEIICEAGKLWKVSLIDPLVAVIARRGPESHGQGELFERYETADNSHDEPAIFPLDRGAVESPAAAIGPVVQR